MERDERDYMADNDKSRVRLSELVSMLTPEQFDASLGEGWTVSAMFAHLAYWDRYATELLRHWTTASVGADAGFTSDPVNTAGLADWCALPHDFARSEAMRAAEEADAQAAAASTEVIEAASAAGMQRTLERNVHRMEHIDQIARTLELSL